MRGFILITAFVFFLSASAAQAEQVFVAVAANFSAPMKAIAADFEQKTGHQLRVIYGSSGKLFAQIVHGAPYQLFLSADTAKPRKLIDQQLAEADTRFTYALGTLVLWTADEKVAELTAQTLGKNSFRHLALANDRLAPYGQAARETLEKLGVWSSVKSKLVTGENIAQVYQFVSTGNADYGFIALSQVIDDGQIAKGAGWVVPQSYHQPIRQDAVLLKKGAQSEAARALLDFIQSQPVVDLIKRYGYQ